MTKNVKIALSIVPFIFFCLIGIEAVYQLSKDKIAEQQQQTLTEKLTKVFPLTKGEKLNPIALTLRSFENASLVPSLKKTNTSNAWLVCNKGSYQGIILSVRSHQGYSGNIDLLLGINAAQKIVGLYVLKHQETPGLGDKIERTRSDWLEQFVGHSIHSSSWQLNTALNVKNQESFDAITAATITSKAIVDVLKSTLQKSSLLKNKKLTCSS